MCGAMDILVFSSETQLIEIDGCKNVRIEIRNTMNLAHRASPAIKNDNLEKKKRKKTETQLDERKWKWKWNQRSW